MNYLKEGYLSDQKACKKEKIIKFLFPFYPLKLFRTTRYLVLLGFFIGLKLLSGLVSIWIPLVRASLSFNFIVIIIIGWNYGPVYSLLIGSLTDNLSWLFSATVWFWMYFISEPLSMFLAGIIGSIYRLRKNIKRIKNDLIFQQIILFILFAISFVFIFYWAKNFLGDDKTILILLIISVCSLVGYILFIEIFVIICVTKNKKNYDWEKNKLLIYSLLIIVINSLVFSFICGPIFAVEYWKYLHNGQLSPMYEKYGSLFYFIPRVIKEAIKFPIGLFLIAPIQTLTQQYIDTIKRHSLLQWKSS